jgi:hypothetical protein
LSLNANKLLNNSFKEEKNIKEFNEIYNEKIKPLESLSYI